jgi:hypothetical protein
MISFKPKAVAIWVSVLVLGGLFLPSSIDNLPPPTWVKLRPVPKQLRSLLVVGDSLSISLGEQLERHFSKYSDRVAFQRLGKVSSGLARPEFFDWEQNLEDLMSRRQTGIVVVMIGTNDNKPLNSDNHSIAFGTASWRREYTARLQRLYQICRQSNPGVRVFWIGAPVMSDPLLNREVRIINRTIASWCRGKPGCEYVSTWSTLADKEGKFAQYLQDEQTGEPIMIRTKDGVHLTSHGSQLLARVTIDAILKHYPLE